MIDLKNVIESANRMHNNRANTIYFLGGEGAPLSDCWAVLYAINRDKIDADLAAIGETVESYIAKHGAKAAYDCSGLVHQLIDAPDMTAHGLISKCTLLVDPKNSVPGFLLYKTGHIGLCTDEDVFIHIPYYGRGIEAGKISEYDWETAGKPSEYVNFRDNGGVTTMQKLEKLFEQIRELFTK